MITRHSTEEIGTLQVSSGFSEAKPFEKSPIILTEVIHNLTAQSQVLNHMVTEEYDGITMLFWHLPW